MALFHQRVIKKHIQHLQDISPYHAETLGKWAENLERGIYDSETQNDGEFIQRILIDILGYVGSSDGQKWTVAKNQPVGKGNVDVALGAFTVDSASIFAPLELKGAKTRDLDAIMAGRNKTPVQQAWEYAMDAKGAQWVLVSNYREIRLYAVGYGRKDYESFDLTDLRKPEHYARFILLLSAPNLLGGKTLSLLKESEQVEKDITDDLYRDYKALRRHMNDTIGKDNPDKNPLDVIRYTQTILDRILFVAFAEDKGLLPDKTLAKAYETQNPFNPQPLWENFKGLFHAINKGNAALNIPGYNGGLFADDANLHSLNISDELCEGFKKLGEYDFDSEISVNILGHIFEQSITDIEELKAQVESGSDDDASAYDKKKGKRKKDGIFYTPAYITRYIVEQAVGGWLSDRRKEIGFDKLPLLTDDDFASIKVTGKRKIKHERNKNIAAHIAAWEAYKEALSRIKVLDPACGSGAFLNEVFDYLKNEGQVINNELARLTGEQTDLFRWDTHILANNIYGVDLNRESVEITKLSLWLKTANRNEKLTYLENNIKVGNSLIDDPSIAGDLAFNWHKEFSGIMDAGGFDIVIGNPPYGASLSTNEKDFIKIKYTTTEYNFDTYISFFELALNILKRDAYMGYITPNTFLVTENSTKIRTLLLADNTLISLLEVFNVFPDAVVEPIVTIIKKTKPTLNETIKSITTPRKNIDFSEKISESETSYFFLSDLLKSEGLVFNYRAKEQEIRLSQKLEKVKKTFSDLFEIKAGVKLYEKGKGTPPQTADTLKNKPYTAFEQVDPSWRKLIRGTDVKRYNIDWQKEWVSYGEWLAAPRNENLFSEPKIVIRRTDDKILACLDTTGYIGVNSIHCARLKTNNIPDELSVYLALLNSRLMNWLFQFNNFHMVGKPLAEVKVVFIDRLPIPEMNDHQKDHINRNAKIILNFTHEHADLLSRLNSLLLSEFDDLKISSALNSWADLSYTDFQKELEKQIKPQKLTLTQKSEWMQHFEAEKAKVLALKVEIEMLDREIDQIVYALYGLTPDEIAVVESA